LHSCAHMLTCICTTLSPSHLLYLTAPPRTHSLYHVGRVATYFNFLHSLHFFVRCSACHAHDPSSLRTPCTCSSACYVHRLLSAIIQYLLSPLLLCSHILLLLQTPRKSCTKAPHIPFPPHSLEVTSVHMLIYLSSLQTSQTLVLSAHMFHRLLHSLHYSLYACYVHKLLPQTSLYVKLCLLMFHTCCCSSSSCISSPQAMFT
jgi:hypothetical protein